jgi:5-methylcytosine-specific restriction endonuclease McrA
MTKLPWDQIFFETQSLPGMIAERECKNCGIFPEYGNFSAVTGGVSGRYKHPNHCIPCVRAQRSKKDYAYDHSARRTLMNALRLERQPWERVHNYISGVYSKVDYDRSDFVKHMESQFEPWMTWENNGRGDGYWQIDHKIPRAFFGPYMLEPYNFCKQFQKTWCLENLRPLNAVENNVKSAKVYLPENLEDEQGFIDCSLEEFKILIKDWNP